jgi:hypothetical protein
MKDNKRIEELETELAWANKFNGILESNKKDLTEKLVDITDKYLNLATKYSDLTDKYIVLKEIK